MGIYKLIKKEESILRKQSEDYSVNNYFTKDFSKDFSLAVCNLSGEHPLTKSLTSDRIYFCIEGKATFMVEGKEVIVDKEDSIFIEKNTEYSFNGNFKAVLVNMPAFGVTNEK